MPKDTKKTYEIRRSGLWSPVHTFSKDGKELGKLKITRNSWGLISAGTYSPEKGEVLYVRRDPGLLRSQFSLWTDGNEWLGSSLRWSVWRREIVMHTGSRPLRVLPLSGLRAGWTLQAPKTGEMARIEGSLLGGSAKITVFRRLEFEVVVFSYFLGAMIQRESLWPGPHVEAPMPTASKASTAS